MGIEFAAAAREALADRTTRPRYLSLADALSPRLEEGAVGLPSARALAAEIGLNRATVTAAYRELARRGLIVLRPGRPSRRRGPAMAIAVSDELPFEGGVDLARYAPDRSLLPTGRVLRWLGLGDGEGEAVAQYGEVRGYPPLRAWISARMATWGVTMGSDDVLLTSGVQHGLDLLMRGLARPGDAVLVEDPTYPGLPPLLAVHRLRPVAVAVGVGGLEPAGVAAVLRRERPALAILTPTLHNPTGVVLDESRRRAILADLLAAGVTVVEEQFDPGLLTDDDAPLPLVALDRRVIAVGSFSKALFPGLRVGWLVGPPATVARIAAVKRATDLSGSPFLEATAFALCRRGELDAQLHRLRAAARTRRRIVLEALASAPRGVTWSEPRGGFSLMLVLPPGWSAREVAARAAESGVAVVPGPLMSVSGRDDVLRVAYAALGGAALRSGVARLVAALRPTTAAAPLV